MEYTTYTRSFSFWNAFSFQELNYSDGAGTKCSLCLHGLAVQWKVLLALCPNAPIVCCVPKWEVFQTDLPHLSFRATMWENQGKVLRPREKILLVVNRKMKLQRKAVMMQSVSCLISPDSSISLYAISAYGPDCACINHTGTAVLSSQEVWLFSLCRLFSTFSSLSLIFTLLEISVVEEELMQ